MTSPVCCECNKKSKEIEYLRALLALDTLDEHRNTEYNPDNMARKMDIVMIKQQQALIRQQLLVIRADVQYMNRHVQAVLQWIAKVISTFLSCCGRLGESTASALVHGASSVLSNVSKIQVDS